MKQGADLEIFLIILGCPVKTEKIFEMEKF